MFSGVAEIYHEASGNYGSGYLITACHVLTARHVALPKGTTPPITKGEPFLVRLIGTSSSWLDASLVWWHVTLDLALLRLNEKQPRISPPRVGACLPLHNFTPVHLGLVPRHGKSIPCYATGFPFARGLGDLKNSESHQVSGDLLPESAVKEGMLELPVRDKDIGQLRASSGPPESPWSGMSGAGLRTEVDGTEVLIGVVKSYERTGIANMLRATPLDQLQEDQDFIEAFTGTGGPPSFVRLAPSSPADSLEPSLFMPTVPDTDDNRFLYSARSIPFVSREVELRALTGFLDDPRQFCWWLITGLGGAGKSRLALESCHRHQSTWRVGFMRDPAAFERWSGWQPRVPTLIVVDYAAEKADELHGVALGLAERQGGSTKVRLLLLEREAERVDRKAQALLTRFAVDRSWMAKFEGAVGTTASAIVRGSAYNDGKPLVLGAMSDDELWEMVANLVRRGGGELPDRSWALARLLEIDPHRRPLFAALAADAIVHQRPLNGMDALMMLNDLLEREVERFWRPAGIEDLESDPHVTLLAIVTALGGCDADELKRGLSGLPGVDAIDIKRYGVMVGRRRETNWLAPLEPDLLGEAFTLEWVRSTPITGCPLDGWERKLYPRWVWLLALGWSNKPNNMHQFLLRAIRDFPEHPTLIDLVMPIPRKGFCEISMEVSWHAAKIYTDLRRFEHVFKLLDAMKVIADQDKNNVVLQNYCMDIYGLLSVSDPSGQGATERAGRMIVDEFLRFVDTRSDDPEAQAYTALSLYGAAYQSGAKANLDQAVTFVDKASTWLHGGASMIDDVVASLAAMTLAETVSAVAKDSARVDGAWLMKRFVDWMQLYQRQGHNPEVAEHLAHALDSFAYAAVTSDRNAITFIAAKYAESLGKRCREDPFVVRHVCSTLFSAAVLCRAGEDAARARAFETAGLKLAGYHPEDADIVEIAYRLTNLKQSWEEA